MPTIEHIHSPKAHTAHTQQDWTSHRKQESCNRHSQHKKHRKKVERRQGVARETKGNRTEPELLDNEYKKQKNNPKIHSAAHFQ